MSQTNYVSASLLKRSDRLTANLLLLVIAILDTGDVDGGLVGEDQTILDQVLVPGVQDGVQHGFVEQEVAHPLRNDDVNFVKRKNNLLHLALEQGNLVRQTVHGDDLLGLADDGRHVNTNNVLCAGLSGEPVYAISASARVMRSGVGRGARTWRGYRFRSRHRGRPYP